MKVEFGGGITSKQGYLNVDILDCADIKFDINTLCPNVKLPLADETISEVYSSHCFEHLTNVHGAVNEIVRILKPGGKCEIRVPHWANAMTHCLGHTHAFSDAQVWQFQDFRDIWFPGEMMLLLKRVSYTPNPSRWARAAKLFPHLSPLELCWFIQDTCFEVRYIFEKAPKQAVSVSSVVTEVV